MEDGPQKIIPTREFFESTFGFNWDLPLVDRTFDRNRIKRYLSSIKPLGMYIMLDNADQRFANELISVTRYIRHQDFKQSLFQSFKKFKSKVSSQGFSLILPSDEINTSYWLTALLWPQLRDTGLHQITNNETIHKIRIMDNILLIDDTMYSGRSMLRLIDCFLNNNRGHYVFHLIVPFATKTSLNELECYFKNKGVECYVYYKYELFELHRTINLDQHYHPHELPLARERFNIPSFKLPPVYFDHKVDTYYSIYLEGHVPYANSVGSLLKSNPSSEKIDYIRELYNKWLCPINPDTCVT